MRSCGCWDAPGAVEEGVAQRGEDGDVVRPGGGDVGTDAAEGLEPAHAPPAPADLGLELGHPDGLFAAVVGPVDVEVDAEVQHLVDPLGHPFGQLVGLLAGAFDARGVGGDALLGGVGVQAAQMRQTLTKARRAVDDAVDAGASNLPPATLGQLRGLYANTAEQGAAANAPGVKGAGKESYKLAKRMAKRIDQVLYFTADFDVDWTNNSCEQAIRMAKLQAKISGSWRSMRGLKAFCRIRSYIATARAHDVPVFTALRDAFLDSPWGIPATA